MTEMAQLKRFAAIIFDLDNCLSAADEVGTELFEPAFAAIRRANHGRLDEATLASAFSDCWRHALDHVAAKHGFSSEMLKAGWDALRQVEVTKPMHGYSDLSVLQSIKASKFLVTSGFRRLQESKIRALGIQSLFTKILVDAIDDAERRGKELLFRDLMQEYRLQPSEVLVVGDNPESEIAAGNRLGLTTVQILRPGVTRSESASRHITSLKELQAW